MDQFNITNAERVGAPPIVCFWGPSGCGKTMTALLTARGLVGDEGQFGVIDTENKRSLLHANVGRSKSGKKWLHLDFQPPFSPERYTAACQALVNAGCQAIIIDSGSHVWEGEGGVLDAAEKIGGNGLRKWQEPKTNYKRMINNSLRATVPVIWCLRSKEGFEQVPDPKKDGKQIIANYGIVPISGKGLIYEMTISILLDINAHPAYFHPQAPYNAHPSIKPVKAPDDLMSIIKPGKHLGEDFGISIAEWIGGGKIFNKHEAELLQAARDFAVCGTAKLQQYFTSLPKEDKAILKPYLDNELKALAADNEPEQEPSSDGEDMFGGEQ